MLNKTPEGFNLFNPAFCAIVIQSALHGFSKSIEKGMPYPLIYLVLPVVLHEEMRKALPRTGRTTLHAWIQKQSYFKIGFPERCSDLMEITREAISFSLNRETIILAGGVALGSNTIKVPKGFLLSTETIGILKSAEILGKLFAEVGSTGTIYSMFGVKP